MMQKFHYLPFVEVYVEFYWVNPWLRKNKMAWELNCLQFCLWNELVNDNNTYPLHSYIVYSEFRGIFFPQKKKSLEKNVRRVESSTQV